MFDNIEIEKNIWTSKEWRWGKKLVLYLEIMNSEKFKSKQQAELLRDSLTAWLESNEINILEQLRE